MTHRQGTDGHVNVGRRERWGSLVGGGVLGALGLSALASGRLLGGAVLSLGGASLLARGATGHCSAYQALGIDTSAKTEPRMLDSTLELSRAITIHRPIEAVRELFQDLENLSRFVPGVESVRVEEARHRMTIGTSRGQALVVEFEREGPDSIRFWSSSRRLRLDEGRVELSAAPGDRGTEVSIEARVAPPGGRFGAAIGHLLRDVPNVAFLGEVLYRLRGLLDAGEIAVSDDTSARHTKTMRRERRQEASRS
jgi:uncharacterized membrane protein